jgi:hypothetical protein
MYAWQQLNGSNNSYYAASDDLATQEQFSCLKYISHEKKASIEASIAWLKRHSELMNAWKDESVHKRMNEWTG